MGKTAILLVDDERAWHKVIKDCLEPERLSIQYTCYGEKAIQIVRNDTEKEIKAVLLDWLLWDPDNPGILQEIPGQQVLEDIIALRPELPIFALTGKADRESKTFAEASEVGVKMMHDHPEFRDYFAKNLENQQLVRDSIEVAKIIKNAIGEVEEILHGIPKGWSESYIGEYMKLRNRKDWAKTEEEIRNKAERDIERYRKGDIRRTLGRLYGTERGGIPIMENVLIARRIVVALLWELKGNYFRLQQKVGYSWDPEKDSPSCPQCDARVNIETMICEDCGRVLTTTITRQGFHKYYFTALGLTVGAVSGQDLLPEEEKWANEYWRKISL